MYLNYQTKEKEILECFIWDDLINDNAYYFKALVNVKNKTQGTKKERFDVERDEYGKFFTYNKEKIYFKKFLHLEYEKLCDLFDKEEDVSIEVYKKEYVSIEEVMACFLKSLDKIVFSCELSVIDSDISDVNIGVCHSKVELVPCHLIIDRNYPINNLNTNIVVEPILLKKETSYRNSTGSFKRFFSLLKNKKIKLFKTKEECISYIKEIKTNN